MGNNCQAEDVAITGVCEREVSTPCGLFYPLHGGQGRIKALRGPRPKIFIGPHPSCSHHTLLIAVSVGSSEVMKLSVNIQL